MGLGKKKGCNRLSSTSLLEFLPLVEFCLGCLLILIGCVFFVFLTL